MVKGNDAPPRGAHFTLTHYTQITARDYTEKSTSYPLPENCSETNFSIKDMKTKVLILGLSLIG